MDIYNKEGKKIGYTDKEGKSVMFSSSSSSTSSKKNYTSKSDAELQTVRPKSTQNFEPFETIFAWKTTKRFGLISVNARRMLNQTNLNGESVKDGFEKWVIKYKDNKDTKTLFGMYDVRKGALYFDLGNTKCIVNHKKKYFSFLTPEYIKKKR
ncbi:hypothetical protein [Flavobacterium crassostreae]|uniref:Uncharacterized protein n=1 Tax=Flavobacterium crassostreae TaxID=1763534 RepID=A0A1B9EA46_9FLAO|nr:hypothetical protein [Flavobacterium crassostreae]OCB78820.1 hypothetical protein LPBF_00075 [Flavobacterium crassostreae]